MGCIWLNLGLCFRSSSILLTKEGEYLGLAYTAEAIEGQMRRVITCQACGGHAARVRLSVTVPAIKTALVHVQILGFFGTCQSDRRLPRSFPEEPSATQRSWVRLRTMCLSVRKLLAFGRILSKWPSTRTRRLI